MHFNFCVQLSSGQVLRGRLTPVRFAHGRISFAKVFMGAADAAGKIVDNWYEFDMDVGVARLNVAPRPDYIGRRLRGGDTVEAADSSITVS